jgi:purine-nucleoside phosphorylase
MSVHLEAKPGDIAPVVLLPGDPLRAQHIADNFLDDAVRYNQVRGAFGFTGTYHGKRLSVQSTGMGSPSISIYAHELLKDHGAKVLLRVGTCGALQEGLALRDLVLALSASTDSAMNRAAFGAMDFAPTADFELLRRAHELATQRGLTVRTGSVLTSDTFYPEDKEWWQLWARHGVLAAEMESAALYTLAARHGARALSLLTVSDHVVKGERLTAEERQGSLTPMIELALELGASFA